MRILFDKNVPVGVRGFLAGHEVRTVVEMGWPQQLENGELLNTAEMATFDVMVTADQNIRYQQNLADRKLALVGRDCLVGTSEERTGTPLMWPGDVNFPASLADMLCRDG